MTTFTLTPALRGSLRRLFQRASDLYVSPAGLLGDWDSVVSLTGQIDASAHFAHTLHGTAIRTVLGADSLTVTEDSLVVTRKGQPVDLHSKVIDSPVADHPALSNLTRAPETVTQISSETTPAAAMMALDDARTNDYSLPVLMGVGFRRSAGACTWTATDRYRAARHFAHDGGEDAEVIVPGRLFATIRHRHQWTLTVHAHVCQVNLPEIGVCAVSLNMDAQYPQMGSLFRGGRFGGGAESVWRIDPARGLAAIQSVETGRNEPIILTEDGTAYSAATPEPVRLAESVEDPDSGPVVAGFNPAYLADVLRAGKAGLGEVAVSMGADRRPVQISFEDYRVDMILMPVRVPVPEPAAA